MCASFLWSAGSRGMQLWATEVPYGAWGAMLHNHFLQSSEHVNYVLELKVKQGDN